MKCATVYAWLLTSRSTDALPQGVARHLRACGHCRARRWRLRGLEQKVQTVPLAELPPERRARLLQGLEALAPVPAAPASRSGASWFRRRWCWPLTAAAALLLGLGLGLLSSQPRATTTDMPSLPSPVVQTSAPKLARFVAHHLALAAAHDPAERVTILRAVAGDLWSESARATRQGTPHDLPLLAGLYERVLRQGIARQALRVPPARRSALLDELTIQLRGTESEMVQLTEQAPLVVADFLQPMGEAARDVSWQLSRPDPAAAPAAEPSLTVAAVPGTTQAVLVGLVLHGLALAEEDERDYLLRAAYCSDVADQLHLAMLMAAARGDQEEAAQWSKYLSDVMDRGVRDNLAKGQHQTPEDPQLAEITRLTRQATQAVHVLKKDLAPAAPLTPPGLRRVFDVKHLPEAKTLDKALKDLGKALRDALRDKKSSPPPKGKEVKGVVQSVDVRDRTIVLLVRDKGHTFEAAYQVTASARIRAGPRDYTLADLLPGSHIKGTLANDTSLSEIKWERKEP
ncbi:MAG: hypothetical protein ACK4RK_21715 [Gemmataceae bacterium]